VAGDGGFEQNSGSDSQALSGGRNGRESEKEACKSHARSLGLAASDGLDGMVICLPDAGTAYEGLLIDMMNCCMPLCYLEMR
jgi:hypothetical protein